MNGIGNREHRDWESGFAHRNQISTKRYEQNYCELFRLTFNTRRVIFLFINTHAKQTGCRLPVQTKRATGTKQQTNRTPHEQYKIQLRTQNTLRTGKKMHTQNTTI